MEAVDPFDQHVSRALSSLAALGFQGLTKSELLRLLPPGKEDPALDIMAEVRAYWQGSSKPPNNSLSFTFPFNLPLPGCLVAYRRFSDLVPLEIDQAYIRAFDSAIHVALVDGLGLTRDGARENCRKWLEEDPAVVAKREELMARKRMLEAALASLACIDLPGGS